MRHFSGRLAAAVLCAFTAAKAEAGPITADAFTVVFDSFNGSTTGTVYNGPLTFVAGQAGFGQAVHFSNSGPFVQYALPWTCCSNTTGTVEFWINPTSAGTVLDGNWLNTTSVPGFGHVLYPSVNPDGTIGGYSYQNQTVGLTSPGPIPFGSWTHFAYTFSPGGSGIYVNGVLVNSTASNLAPVFSSMNWVYLTPWGTSGFTGAIDDLRISNVVRSAAEIQAAASPVPEPATLGLVGLGLVAVAHRVRRRRPADREQ
jgi:hypothetical protein